MHHSLIQLSNIVAICLLISSVGRSEPLPPIREWIEQFTADLETLDHRYRVPLDVVAKDIRQGVLQSWIRKLQDRDFESLDRVDKIDYLLLRTEIEYRSKKLQLDWSRDSEAQQSFLPYATQLIQFCKAREDVEPIDAQQSANVLDQVAAQVEQLSTRLSQLEKQADSKEKIQKQLQGLRASELASALESRMNEAHRFYTGFDPLYSWWAAKPYERLEAALKNHRRLLREKVVEVPESDNDTIIGLPIGAHGLQLELEHEWIAHSPEELVALAEREMQWCEAELGKATAALGFEDDWRAATEFVKSKHVAPGDQPQLIRDLAWEAIRFLQAHDLVTIPELAANGWRMNMMSPERQRVSPYFLGGDTIIVSFPTDGMTHEEKLMSMRSNNEHFARATVHHELIPGHHLQHYMTPRYRPYRQLFATPFWIEGWALYWEMLLWDLNFAHGPEDRVGMLFWRKHRCARIIFSLSYHLGTMSPEECIQYLVDKVGHERSAATAEVRRSIMGGYSPLYQAAYMLGGLQLRAMHKELVQSGLRTNREYHDAVLHENSIPIEVLRLYLVDQPLRPDQKPSWRFAELSE
ncbi:MAG: DUF885 family protein [Planctomycetales bacterium]|nr:DUF885 family protein [Planctomycetales bacterium]